MFDLVTAGELLIDLISEEPQGLTEAQRFGATVGGAPTNTAITASRLGGSVATVGCVGSCGLGGRVDKALVDAGITPFVERAEVPTTLALVSRSSGTPEFVIIRGADRLLSSFEMPPARWFHTSLFALSEDPQRSAILSVLERFGGVVSIDANYAQAVWHERPVEPVLDRLAATVSVVKASTDDCSRIFGTADPDSSIDRFRNLGFTTVLLTHGGESVVLAREGEIITFPVPARDVVDVTGAGDAFMAGVIMARLDALEWTHAVRVGIEVAGRSVEVIGHVPEPLDRKAIYAATAAAMERTQ